MHTLHPAGLEVGREGCRQVCAPREPVDPETCPSPHWPRAPGGGKGNLGAVSKAPSVSSNNPVTSRVLLLTDTLTEPDREPPSSSRRLQTCGQQVRALLKTHHHSVHRRHVPHQVTGRQDEIRLVGSVSSRAALASLMESRCPTAPRRLSCRPSRPLGAWAGRGLLTCSVSGSILAA